MTRFEAIEVAAVDFSLSMLNRARKKSSTYDVNVNLIESDVQQLPFPDDFFYTIFATFVFCSVPNPVMGFKELNRVCKPKGRLFLIEHVRPSRPFLGAFFDLINPVVVGIMGANINRRTLVNVYKAGWRIQSKRQLFSDIVLWIEAESIKAEVA